MSEPSAAGPGGGQPAHRFGGCLSVHVENAENHLTVEFGDCIAGEYGVERGQVYRDAARRVTGDLQHASTTAEAQDIAVAHRPVNPTRRSMQRPFIAGTDRFLQSGQHRIRTGDIPAHKGRVTLAGNHFHLGPVRNLGG